MSDFSFLPKGLYMQLKLMVFLIADGVCSACTSKYAYAATCNAERVLSW